VSDGVLIASQGLAQAAHLVQIAFDTLEKIVGRLAFGLAPLVVTVVEVIQQASHPQEGFFATHDDWSS
jgi:hypothetical protein